MWFLFLFLKTEIENKASQYCEKDLCKCTTCYNQEEYYDNVLNDAIQKVLQRGSPDAMSFADVSSVSARKQNHRHSSTSTSNFIALICTCKCKKSRCLKKYCECYARGSCCNNECACMDCENQNHHRSSTSSNDSNDSPAPLSLSKKRKKRITSTQTKKQGTNDTLCLPYSKFSTGCITPSPSNVPVPEQVIDKKNALNQTSSCCKKSFLMRKCKS